MTYKPGIPLPTDRPSISQGDIKDNFGLLNSIFAVNHYEYNWGVVVDRGKARYITYVNQGVLNPVSVGTDWISYARFTPITATNSAPYIRTATKIYATTVVIEVNEFKSTAGQWNNLYDFAGQPPMMGGIYIVDSGTPARTIFSQFHWDGTTIKVPTNLVTSSGSRTKSFRDSDKGAILSSGDEMTSLKYDDTTPDTSMLQIWTNVAIDKVRTRIVGILI